MPYEEGICRPYLAPVVRALLAVIVEKPVKPDELKAAVQAVLGSRRTGAAPAAPAARWTDHPLAQPAAILAVENVDGALVGGASLTAAKFVPIIEAAAR